MTSLSKAVPVHLVLSCVLCTGVEPSSASLRSLMFTTCSDTTTSSLEMAIRHTLWAHVDTNNTSVHEDGNLIITSFDDSIVMVPNEPLQLILVLLHRRSSTDEITDENVNEESTLFKSKHSSDVVCVCVWCVCDSHHSIIDICATLCTTSSLVSSHLDI